MPDRKRQLGRVLIWLLPLALLIAGLVLWRVQVFSLDGRDSHETTFLVGAERRAATLVLPEGVENPPVAVIVHGDGPQTRWADGGYLPLVHVLLDAGIGVFSWDKPGTGQSPGNWLDQSMSDRAIEAAAALRHVRSMTGGPAGYLGFSQAGWALPRATQTGPAPDFTLLIGAAVNWRAQGVYYTQRRLTALGMSEAEAAEYALQELTDNDALFRAGTGAPRTDMTPDRLAFVARAYDSDARTDIARMRGPVLALWGDEDVNVDPNRNSRLYRGLLPDPARQQADVIPRATHSLLRAGIFNTQLSSDWSLATRVAFIALGPHSYAPGATDRITGWIHDQTAP